MRKYLAALAGVVSTFIGLTSVHAQSAFSNAVTALTPVAYWPLNETTAPPGVAPTESNLGSLGSAYDGTYGGNITFGATGALAGTNQTAVGFDGLSGNLRTTYGSGVSNSPSFTIEAWLLSHNVSATQCPLSDVDAATPRSGWLIYMDISNPGQYTIRTYNQNGTTPSLSMNIGDPGSIVQDQWYHLAVVVSNGVTATNVYAYIDGALVSGPTALPGFVPNDGLSPATFAIGERSDASFFFDGNIAEVAYYSAALDPATIAAHYTAGTNTTGTPYSTAVLASDPILYYHVEQTASPVAHNYGSLGAGADGYYQTGTVPGVAGPSFGPFANGFGGSDFATQFSPGGTESGSSGPSVTCAASNPNILNDTNSITVSAWVKIPTNTVGWFTGILGRGDNSYRFAVDPSGLPHFANGGNGNADIVGVAALNDGNWHYWVGTYDSASSNAVLYIDSVSAGTVVWNTPPGSADNAFLIGGAPDYNGRNFVGEIAQVAIFNSVLTVPNIQAVYNSTAPSAYQQAVVAANPLAYWPLTETAQPPAVGTFVATNLGTVGSSLDAAFDGDVIFGVPGALGANDSADEFNGASYAITPYTSDIANNPPFTIEAWLNSHNINATQCPLCDMDASSAGRSGWLIYMDISNPGQYTFRAYADNGTTPSLALNIGAADSVLQDQWNHVVVVVSNAAGTNMVYGYLNGALVAGPVVLPAYVPDDGLNLGTFAIGERSDISFQFDGALDEVAYYTNALDPATIAAHYQAGTNTSATVYSDLVLQQNPIIYFRMDEAPTGVPYPGSLPVAANYGSSGPSANGYYEPGTTPGVPGPFGSNSLACLFTPVTGGPAGTSGPGVQCDPLSFTALNVSNALTLAAWVQVPTTPNAAFETVVGRGDSSYRFSVDATQFPHFAAAPNGDLIGTTAINDGAWHLWAGVYNPVTGKADFYIDGLVAASATWSALGSTEQYVFIGGAPDYSGANNNSRAFTGSISDVAIFTNAYTQAQIQQLYATIGVPPSPPVIVVQPVPNDILLAGATLNASVLANGPGTLTYQWYFNSSNQIVGATSAALTLAGVQATNIGSYSCTVSNRYGTTNSTALSLNVIAPTVYEATAILADHPLAYLPLNETNGTVAYDLVGGYDGGYSNGPTLDVPGPSSYLPVGVGFDGQTQFALVPDEPGLDFAGQVTLEAWVQPGTQIDTLSDILAKGYDANQNSAELQIRVQVTNFDGGYYNATVGGKGVTGGDTTTNWMHVALTWDGADWNLYINGLSVGSFADPVGVENFSDPWGIADGTTSGNTRFFLGNICGVAIYDHALTPEKVQAHYNIGFFGTTNVPPTVVVPAGPITVDQGGSGSIPSTIVNGPAPYTYQWYYLAPATNLVAGATNGTLTLTDIQAVQANYQYYVVVSNAFGATTSSVVALNILSGAPVLTADISPLLTEVPAGLPVNFFVTATGTEPFSYQWSSDGTAIPGATKSTYSLTALAGSNTYSVVITNVDGSIPSSTAVVIGVTTPPTVIGFNGTGSNWVLNQYPGVTFLPFITNDILELTDGNTGESSSAFYNTPQYIGGFTASFTYQVGAASSVADGVTFCLQDNTNSLYVDTTNASVYGPALSAVGNGGGDLGYNAISPSVAFQMNVYLGSSGGVGIGFATNGITVDSTPANPPYGGTPPVNISSFDPILVQLAYSNNVMNVTLTDGKLAFNTNYPCNIPGTLGSSSAYVGFTGASGGVGGLQTVSGFQFLYIQPAPAGPVLSVTKGTAGSVVIAWPTSASPLFVLQQATSLNGTWSAVGTAPVIVGSENEVTLTPTVTTFYRLFQP